MSKLAVPSQAKDKARPRFDVGALREIAGEKVFARGNEYYEDGQVQILALEPDRVLAGVVADSVGYSGVQFGSELRQ